MHIAHYTHCAYVREYYIEPRCELRICRRLCDVYANCVHSVSTPQCMGRNTPGDVSVCLTSALRTVFSAGDPGGFQWGGVTKTKEAAEASSPTQVPLTPPAALSLICSKRAGTLFARTVSERSGWTGDYFSGDCSSHTSRIV